MENTRRGSEARVRRRVNSLFASFTSRSAHPRPPGDRVDHELPHPKRPLAALGAAPEHRPDPDQELRVVEGLSYALLVWPGPGGH